MGVSGIGGFMLRADDPDALRAWYAADPSVFMPCTRASDMFAADRAWMLNLRVEGLDVMLAALAAAGIEVTPDPDWDMPGGGRFARLQDPEGNPIELWEPDAADSDG